MTTIISIPESVNGIKNRSQESLRNEDPKLGKAEKP
jgi:hypothetical protein